VRGQISTLPAAALALPLIPVAGAGYLLPELGGGRAMFGATAQRGDDDASVRADDHRANLEQLAQLVGHPIDADPAAMLGRTAWRWSAVDRLPLIGAVPDPDAPALRLDQPRFVPRVPGLFVFTALGSRGITWSALGAQLLASWISGAPAPVEASLIDAVDPARFVSRRARRSTAS
jgi:tRNA 5-methylaminomethyl-2-thiouridine biosynthesis bifunctional protein